MIPRFVIRWTFAWRVFRSAGRYFNRKVFAEQVLLDVANGKRAALTGEQCRALALHLGDATYVIPKGLFDA